MSFGETCRECGTVIPTDSPSGFCAGCLLRLGLEAADDLRVVEVEIDLRKPKPGKENSGEPGSSPQSGNPKGPVLDTAGPTEQPGDRIGRYRVLGEIGHGGCGVVYMAEQVEPVHRRVALKVIKLGMDTKQVVARFEAERQALALMDHPNIAKVLDAGATEAGRPYFVMELVGGIRITEYCDKNKLPTSERLKLFTQVCQAIQHAHQKGIIHRDIKPSNILVSLQDGVPVPKVIDFGIAKATQGRLTDRTLFTAFEQFVGTPAYMSPEQAEVATQDIDTRTDIYSLGVLLYEMLTGKTPFKTEELLACGLDEMRRTLREKEPMRPSTRLRTMVDEELDTAAKVRCLEAHKLIHVVSGDLDWIVMKCLEKDRGRRYGTANGLARDIERHLENQPVAARPPSRVYRLQRLIRRNRLIFGAVGAVLAALVIGFCVSTQLFLQERRTRQRAVSAEKRQEELRRQAEATGKRLSESLMRLDLQRAEDLLQAGKSADALAHLSRLLRTNLSDRVVADRLLAVLSQGTFALPLFEPVKHAATTGSMFSADGAPLASVQFSPDGRNLLTVAGAGARVFDARTGLPITEPLRHLASILAARFSTDGKYVVLGSSDGDARIWQVAPGEPRAKLLQSGRGDVRYASFSPDGRRLATASQDHTGRIWDIETGRLITDKLQHKGTVDFIDFSPDGRQVITCSHDGTARIWNAENGEPITEPLSHNGEQVRFAVFSSDGRRVVTAGGDAHLESKSGAAHIWDVPSGHLLAGPLVHSGTVRCVSLSPDGKRVATASDDKTARIWDAETGQPLTPPLGHEGSVRFAQFHPSGQILLTVGLDGIAHIWDVRTGNPACEPLRHDKGISSAQFSPDGRWVVTSAGDGVQMWDAHLLSLLPIRLFHQQRVQDVCFMPNGSRVVTASGDITEPSNGSEVRIWDPWAAQPLVARLSHESVVSSVEISPNGQRLVTLCGEPSHILPHVVTGPWQRVVPLSGGPDPLEPASLWDVPSGRLLSTLLGHKRQINSARFSPDGLRLLTASDDGTARIWNSRDGAPLIPPFEHTRSVCYAEFSPDGTRIAIASGESDAARNPIGTARIWDVRTRSPLTGPMVHGTLVTSVQFSADGRKVATTSDDKAVRVWDAENGKLLAGPLVHKAVVRSARFSPDGRLLVTASDDSTARVWNATTGEAESPPLRHEAEVYFARFFRDGLRVMTASRDRTVRVWDVKTGQALSNPFSHDTSIQSAEISHDGHWILAAAGNHAFLWEVISGSTPVPDWLPALGEAIAGERLNLQGVLEPVEFGEILKLKERLSGLVASDFYSRWARWFWADRSTRAVSPSSNVTLSQYVQQRLDENTLDSLQEALKLLPGNPVAIARLPAAITKQAQEQKHRPAQLVTSLKTIPARDPQARPELIDLSQFYNASLKENWHPAGEGSDLSELPTGIQSFAGIQFDVRGLIQVGYLTRLNEKYPAEVTGIPISQTCRRLHFLHAAIRAAHIPDGVRIGSYVIHYASGRRAELPILIGESVANWASEPDAERKALTVAWSGSSADSRRLGRTIHLFKSTWENPAPADTIHSIDFISITFSPAPFLVAVTAE